MRVVAAMSGGVDSAVAAAELVAAGHDVLGVHLSLKGEFAPSAAETHGCGSASDTDDARVVADKLGIDFEVWNLATDFRTNVVDYFLDEYAQGRTPNPCLRCNATIKFAGILAEAARRGFDAVGTGHYARIDPTIPALYRAATMAKDQSYVLSVLTKDQLSCCLFPLGEFATKADVRSRAEALGFTEVSEKPDSVDICFIPDKDTAGFLRRHLGEQPGVVVDETGQPIGSHAGTHQFTIGQRKGLKLGKPAADGRPRYVLDIQPATGRVVVGPAEAGQVRTIVGRDANWLVEPKEYTCLIQVRAHGQPLPGRIIPDGSGLRVELERATAGVAAGQGVVAYDGDRVLVQAFITSAARDEEQPQGE